MHETRQLTRNSYHIFRCLPSRAMLGLAIFYIEKSNPEKLEQFVCLAAHRGWEVTIVSACCPTARGARQNPQVNCWHWKWEGWELIDTGSVGILLNPDWSHAWHTHRAPKYRSPTGRVLSLVLPRDPLSLKRYRATPSFMACHSSLGPFLYFDGRRT